MRLFLSQAVILEFFDACNTRPRQLLPFRSDWAALRLRACRMDLPETREATGDGSGMCATHSVPDQLFSIT